MLYNIFMNLKIFIKNNWLLILSLIYIISPIDFVPEFLLGPLGLIDDLGLVIVLLVIAIYKHSKANKSRIVIDQ